MSVRFWRSADHFGASYKALFMHYKPILLHSDTLQVKSLDMRIFLAARSLCMNYFAAK